MKTGWKLLFRREFPPLAEQPTEWLESATLGALKTIYKTNGEWTKPPKKGGPLTVFETLTDALNFSKSLLGPFSKFTQYCIRKCQYTPSRSEWIWNGHGPSGQKHIVNLPRGTVLAEEILILDEEVSPL